ncbi:MAG: LytR/AlgR family response regulator transcription factor [Anaerovoracaceae bacterium]
MKAIYVDDENLAIQRFKLMIEGISRFSCEYFSTSEDAVIYSNNTEIDVAFLDIHMPDIDGLALARELKKINENTRIVFVTAFEKYALDAFDIDAVGYLVKPYSKEKLLNEIDKSKRIKNIIGRDVFVKTMPRFDVFVDGDLLIFPGNKAKELFALVIDKNGGELSCEYACTYLWEDRPYDNKTKTLYRVLKKSMMDTLKKAGIEYVLTAEKGKIAANKAAINCDLYNMIEISKAGDEIFDGRYMFEYQWAEETVNRLKYK